MLKYLSAIVISMALLVPAANAMKLQDYHKDIMTNDNGQVECSNCHGQSKHKTIPKSSACEACHGSAEEMAELTKLPADASPTAEPNPHNSMHYGTDLPCTSCHHEHKDSVVYCNQCHEFKFPKLKGRKPLSVK
ncbi:cytochrome c3 family protein [Shewanella intestini]|uniref:Cytochrome c3 family protein n=1 Tax=Shewanella intestini TaxID=2017544 RepID=A0ABS5I3J2_9GAMM|nr:MULTISPECIES: cytochrome c3 family protein [Shewanella]MBR9728596.1 cytochrome c3 family protein [Shewanella intestini]MRG37347.1 cytochrome C [Shewanella sp. XMDDZSB0408]